MVLEFTHKIFAQVGDPFGTIYKFWQFAWEIMPISYSFPDQILYRFYTNILTHFFGEIATFNLLTLFSFVFSAIPFYLIAKKITKNSLVSFFAGFIIAICPYRIAHLMQHLSLSNIGFLGFFIYYLVLLEEKFSSKNIIFLGLFFLLALFDSYTYGFFAILVFAVYIIVKIISEYFKKPRTIITKKELITLICSFIVIGILVGFFIISPIYSETSSIKDIERGEKELAAYSAYGGYYLFPSPQNPWFGKYSKDYFSEKVEDLGTNYTEQTNYLGYVILFLTLFYLGYFIKNYKVIKREQKFIAYFFILIGILGVYFSFSYPIKLGNWNISFANKIFSLLPFLRVYSRFGLLVIIALAVLSALGLNVIFNKIKNYNLKILLLIVVFALISFEYIIWPKDRIQAVSFNYMSEVYQNLLGKNCVLLEYPFFSDDAPQGYEYLIWNRYTNCKLINNQYKSFYDYKNFYETVRDLNSESDIQCLREKGINYIIINNDLFYNTAEWWLRAQVLNNIPPNLEQFESVEKIGEWDNQALYKINDDS